jgi:hypothetical protein
MEDISRNAALDLLSKWERQNLPISLFCFSPSFGLRSKRGRLVVCLDESLDFSLADDSELRISISEAAFSRLRSDDFDGKLLNLVHEFGQGIRINFPNLETEWYLLASSSPA